MSKRNVIEDILGKLDAYIAMDGKLPATSENKVSVDGLVRAIGCKPSDSQHFFRKDEIKLAVNALAESQGLKPIGFRAEQTEQDKAFRSKYYTVKKNAKLNAESAMEARSTLKLMQKENDELRQINSDLERKLTAANARLSFTRKTGNQFREEAPK